MGFEPPTEVGFELAEQFRCQLAERVSVSEWAHEWAYDYFEIHSRPSGARTGFVAISEPYEMYMNFDGFTWTWPLVVEGWEAVLEEASEMVLAMLDHGWEENRGSFLCFPYTEKILRFSNERSAVRRSYRFCESEFLR